jgi:hypothetical protein
MVLHQCQSCPAWCCVAIAFLSSLCSAVILTPTTGRRDFKPAVLSLFLTLRSQILSPVAALNSEFILDAGLNLLHRESSNSRRSLRTAVLGLWKQHDLIFTLPLWRYRLHKSEITLFDLLNCLIVWPIDWSILMHPIACHFSFSERYAFGIFFKERV